LRLAIELLVRSEQRSMSPEGRRWLGEAVAALAALEATVADDVTWSTTRAATTDTLDEL
jgi:DNA-binding transcriptional LysR family regulator